MSVADKLFKPKMTKLSAWWTKWTGRDFEFLEFSTMETIFVCAPFRRTHHGIIYHMHQEAQPALTPTNILH